jgi:predicted nucleotidyltransferase
VRIIRPGHQSRLEQVRSTGIELTAALAELGAHNIRVFGSVARGDDRPDSDIDLLVDLDDGIGLVTLGRIRSAAERILGGPVDVVPADGLRESIRDEVLAEAVSLNRGS